MQQRIITNKNVLVTGGGGFIGSNLCDTLINQGNKVVCLDNFITGKRENIQHLLSNANFKLVEGDICNLEDCKKSLDGVEIVLHQAALGSIPRSIKDPIKTNSINVDGFLNILVSSKDAGIKRIVYASSSSVYGTSKELPKQEEIIGEPLSPYAITKRVDELYAKVFSDLYGLEIIGLRYFNVYGKKQDPTSVYAAVIPKFISSLIQHESPIINGDGSYSRDFTFVEDVVQINQLAALTENKDALNNVYNVAAGGRYTINRLYELIHKNLSKYDINIEKIQPIYGEVRSGDIPHSQASIEKAKDKLKYEPKYKLEEGIESTVEWYLKNLKQNN